MKKRASIFPILIISSFLIYFAIINFSTTAGDGWLHLAVIESFQRNLWNPAHETLASVGAFRDRHTPYHFLLATFGIVTKISSFRILQVAGVFNLFFFVFAALAMFSRLDSHKGKSLLDLSLYLLIMLFLHHHSYLFSGETSFRSMHYMAQLPSFFALAMTYFVFFLTDIILEKKLKSLTLILSLPIAFIILIHPLTGSCLLIQTSVQAAVHFWKKGRPPLSGVHGGILLACALGVFLTFLWPFYQPVDWLTFANAEDSRLYENIIQFVGGLIILSVVPLYFCLRAGRQSTLIALIVICAMVYLLSYILQASFFNRYLLFLSNYMQIFLAVFLGQGFYQNELNKAQRIVMKTLAALALILAVCSHENHEQIKTSWPIFTKGLVSDLSWKDKVEARMAMPKHYLGPQDNVLLSFPDSFETDRIAAFTGARMVYSRHTYTHPEYRQRQQDARLFFTTDNPRQRKRILDEYQVSVILIFKGDVQKRLLSPNLVGALGKPQDQNSTFFYYRVDLILYNRLTQCSLP